MIGGKWLIKLELSLEVFCISVCEYYVSILCAWAFLFPLSSPVISCVLMCLCVHAGVCTRKYECAYTRVCLCVQQSETDVRGLPLMFSTLVLETGPSHWSWIHHVSWNGWPMSSSDVCLCPQHWSHRYMSHHLAFYTSVKDLNPYPHDCATSTLLTRPSSYLCMNS